MESIRPISLPYRISAASLVLFCMYLLSACDASVDVIVPTDAPFTMYGVLSPVADTQWVRVLPVVGSLSELENNQVSILLSSTDLETGQSLDWDLASDDRISIGQLFFAPFTPVYTHRYRLQASGSEGTTSSVELTIPSEVNVRIGEGVPSYPVTIPIEVEGDDMRLLHVEMIYHLDYRFQPNELDDTPVPDPYVVLDYEDMAVKTATGWSVPLTLAIDYVRLFRDIQARTGAQINRLYGLRIRDVTFSFLAASEEWSPPGGVFDPEILVQPGAMSNVDNGFGFVGAGYRVKVPFYPADVLAETAGFVVPRDTSSMAGE